MFNENDLKVVRVSNISNFDFTAELGARYGGRDFFVPAGGSLLAPFTVGDHLAMHLARQIILKGAPVRDAGETDGKGTDRPLWNDASINALKAKILTDMYSEEKVAPKSEADMLAERVAELNKVRAETESNPSTGGSADTSPTTTTAPTVYKDKREVIKELEKRKVTFDARKSKADLEKLLAS